MPRKTISAVITNYNYGSYVVQAIDSVLGQNIRFDQVIVVDDGSTDNSLLKINQYADRVEIVAKPNGGQHTARMAGLEKASSDYVFFLDADDFLHSEFTSAIHKALESNPVKVQMQMISVDGQGKLMDSIWPTYPENYASADMIQDNIALGFYMCPPTSANVFRRDVLLAMDLNRLGPGESIDGQPALAIPYFGEVVSYNQALTYYRIHGANHSQWYRPDPKLFQFEVDWFNQRWVDTCMILNRQSPPFGDETPAYVLERQLMSWALGSGRGGPGLILKFIRRLAQSRMAMKQKLMLTGWALAMVAPSARIRRSLVEARRSPTNRSALFNHLLGLVLGRRAPPAPAA